MDIFLRHRVDREPPHKNNRTYGTQGALLPSTRVSTCPSSASSRRRPGTRWRWMVPADWWAYNALASLKHHQRHRHRHHRHHYYHPHHFHHHRRSRRRQIDNTKTINVTVAWVDRLIDLLSLSAPYNRMRQWRWPICHYLSRRRHIQHCVKYGQLTYYYIKVSGSSAHYALSFMTVSPFCSPKHSYICAAVKFFFVYQLYPSSSTCSFPPICRGAIRWPCWWCTKMAIFIENCNANTNTLAKADISYHYYSVLILHIHRLWNLKGNNIILM